ncbi:hypothetical protein [Melittangium boletus]|uniref:hypothetical protein n=1 Tax=Melittangium boletus TaxID=83453 RepID=UPI003DA265A1
MHRHWKFLGLPLLLGAALFACSAEDEPTGSLEVTLGVIWLDGQGEGTTLYVTALDAEGKPGTGSVKLIAERGVLADAGAEAEVTLQGGKASVSYACTSTPEKRCENTARIRAEWNGVKDSVLVNFPAAEAPEDAGTGDGGTRPDAGAGDGGTRPDAGTDGGR